jgi:hypothetical protein
MYLIMTSFTGVRISKVVFLTLRPGIVGIILPV